MMERRFISKEYKEREEWEGRLGVVCSVVISVGMTMS